MKAKLRLLSTALIFAIFICGAWSSEAEKQASPKTVSTASIAPPQYELPKLGRNHSSNIYEIKTTSRSYYERDDQGRLTPEQRGGKKYFAVREGVYNFFRKIDTTKTALIVMDPWEDSGSPFLNNYYGPVIKERLLPLINKSVFLGIPVIIMTNAPNESYDYSNKVHSEIDKLARLGKVHIVYHEAADSSQFSEWLRRMSIDTLIYSGFASNMCVLGTRSTSMLPMHAKGFRLFFVPEASAAVEFMESWETGAVHESTTLLISQWLGELISLNDFLMLTK